MAFSRLSYFASSFLDGFSLADLFFRLRRPGAPVRVFTEEPKFPFSKAKQESSSRDELERARIMLQQAGYDVRRRQTGSVQSWR